MQRRLLLLTNKGVEGTSSHRPSVLDAAERYRLFFKSPLGGFWDDGEIIEMPANLKAECEAVWLSGVISQLNTLTTYSVVVFTGHGGAVKVGYNGVECIQLQGGYFYPIGNLLGEPSQIKRTVIVDACRCRTWLTEAEQHDKDRAAIGEATKDLNATDCRDYYNEIISNTPAHVELVQSTQYGEPAHVSQTGSVFCDSLFNVIYSNATTWNMTALCNGQDTFFKTTEELVDCATPSMEAIGQKPQFRVLGNDSGRFPFYGIKRIAKLT